MSKLSALGQSMASLFTPESDRIRAGQKKSEAAPGTAASPIKVPGTPALGSQKPGDSLGNPNGPGYEFWGRKKKSEDSENDNNAGSKGPGGKLVETSQQGPEFIRLTAGWEKLLLSQKKLCDKAKGLFTLLEGPTKYSSQKKSKLILGKSRGCILDLDVQEVQDEKAHQLKMSKEKESA